MQEYTKAEAKAADAILAELTEVEYNAYAAWESAADRVHSAAGDNKTYGGYWKLGIDEALAKAAERAADETIVKYNRDGYQRAIDAYAPAVEARRAAGEAIRVHEAANYKGWLRFFLVPGGHIHRSRGCSSLRITTRIGWLPNLSGETEADAVAEHGAMLCTKCFPSAPVEWTMGKPVDPNACKGSGEAPVEGTIVRRYRSAYAECTGCGVRQVYTMSGVIKKHKTPKGK
ncbi:hypothetical protein SEA_AMOHNITION_88 [Mycobacterium phage Amohnition]|uniref:Uncharacterized protein n=1 Tax=Mycobacterium phage Amohnition TaxID=2015874 RepID=A0A222ZPC4_9CAUD|nr:hypothetical protein I5G85_gp11 [Mycobacterium phage Amohnition]ASR86368.1 hypothetical protein SEA_AMOHNITION_88 [Mycobacterium phage Amohnition]